MCRDDVEPPGRRDHECDEAGRDQPRNRRQPTRFEDENHEHRQPRENTSLGVRHHRETAEYPGEHEAQPARRSDEMDRTRDGPHREDKPESTGHAAASDQPVIRVRDQREGKGGDGGMTGEPEGARERVEDPHRRDGVQERENPEHDLHLEHRRADCRDRNPERWIHPWDAGVVERRLGRNREAGRQELGCHDREHPAVVQREFGPHERYGPDHSAKNDHQEEGEGRSQPVSQVWARTISSVTGFTAGASDCR